MVKKWLVAAMAVAGVNMEAWAQAVYSHWRLCRRGQGWPQGRRGTALWAGERTARAEVTHLEAG